MRYGGQSGGDKTSGGSTVGGENNHTPNNQAGRIYNSFSFFKSFKYGGHAATLLVYFIFLGCLSRGSNSGLPYSSTTRYTCELRRHAAIDVGENR